MGGKVLDLPCFQIFDQGVEKGIAQGLEQGLEQGTDKGIRIFIEDKLEDNVSVDIIESKLCKKYSLSNDKAKEYIKRVIEDMKAKNL